MKIPILCPKCNKPMLTHFSYHPTDGHICCKTCKQYNHDVSFFSHEKDYDTVHLIMITVNLTSQLHISFDFWQNKVFIYQELDPKNNASLTTIPFFEPDFSNYDDLIKKLQTYIVFL